MTKRTCKDSGKEWYLALTYASNIEQERNQLWQLLEGAISIFHEAWLVAGDFNCVRYQDEKIGGSPIAGKRLEDFNKFIEASALFDLKVAGALWTWRNKQEANPIACKLDRILVNDEWLEQYSNSSTVAGSALLSDHVPIHLSLNPVAKLRYRGFKYFNHWDNIQGYKEAVDQAWESNYQGNPMFQFTMKLKQVKHELIAWCKRIDLSNPEKSLKRARDNLSQIQLQLNKTPLNSELAEQEKGAIKIYIEELKREEESLRLKARATWIQCGDHNSKFFHSMHRSRMSYNAVSAIKSSQRIWIDNQEEINL